MNQYTIYAIKEEFAHFFYFRSDVLYRFLKSYEQGEKYDVFARQFDFITIELAETSVLSHINRFLPSHIHMARGYNTVKIYNNRHSISLHIGEKHINFWGDIVHAAEDLFFPVLRLFHPYFFVAGDNVYNSGWIAPVTLAQNKDKHEQVLYSYF
ncbi:hypothetical protein GCM10028778_04290 [Barrientosiimonas marina]|uniref:Sporulation inhibitor of replication protein SirA n=1 Tax=Lentibacillus kimchii TaxID=1542911 RepID=A0ABW2UPR6_9BACI